MVIARIFGGLGNQLFCYAAARRLALVNDAPLRLDTVTGFARDGYQREYLLDRFNIPCQQAGVWEAYSHPLGLVRRYLERQLNQRLPYERRWFLTEPTGRAFDPRLLGRRVEHAVYLEGYWQSERYFADVAATIRSDLELARPPSDASKRLADQMHEQQSVSVHFRSFREVPARVQHTVLNAALGPEYYGRAVQYLAERVKGLHFYLFSDDMAWAERQLGSQQPCTLVDVNDRRGYDGAVDDLWIMTQCRHHIVSNSSFSWWGAWLSPPGGLTVAPASMAALNATWVPEAWMAV